MPPVQTAYNTRPLPGYEGQVVNMETQNSITRNVENVEGIGWGMPVTQGVNDKGVLLPDTTAFEAAGAAVGGNTGNGTITASPTVAAGVKEGVYRITATEPSTNGGTFEVENPDGVVVGVARVGVAFNGAGLGFTIADGATDFVAGDAFTVTVTAEEGGGAFRGITIRDLTQPVKVDGFDGYRQNASAGILVDGSIWVKAGGAVKSGRPAFFDTATKRYVAQGGFPLPNCSFDTSGGNGDLVQLRVSAL